MKTLLIILTSTILFSCNKEIILPNQESDRLKSTGTRDYVTIAFNDVFNSNTDSIYIFESNSLIDSLRVDKDDIFIARLDYKYSFKKKDSKNKLIPLYGQDTYFTFLTTNSNPQYCTDYVMEGLYIIALVTNQADKYRDVDYTFNAWF